MQENYYALLCLLLLQIMNSKRHTKAFGVYYYKHPTEKTYPQDSQIGKVPKMTSLGCHAWTYTSHIQARVRLCHCSPQSYTINNGPTGYRIQNT